MKEFYRDRGHRLAEMITKDLSMASNKRDLRIAAAPLAVSAWFEALPLGSRTKICRLIDHAEARTGGTSTPPIQIAVGPLKQVMGNPLQHWALTEYAVRGTKQKPRGRDAEVVGGICGSLFPYMNKEKKEETLKFLDKHKVARELALENYRLSDEEKSGRFGKRREFDYNRDGVLQSNEISAMRQDEQRDNTLQESREVDVSR